MYEMMDGAAHEEDQGLQELDKSHQRHGGT